MVGRTILVLVFGLAGAGLLSGCGPSPATVSGAVTVDGKPLDGGVISYVPADGNGASVTAPVENGRYELRTAPGAKRVQISAPTVVGKRKEYNGPNAPLVEVTAERLPERYNTKTGLTADIRPGGNVQDWAVQSKGRNP